MLYFKWLVMAEGREDQIPNLIFWGFGDTRLHAESNCHKSGGDIKNITCVRKFQSKYPFDHEDDNGKQAGVFLTTMGGLYIGPQCTNCEMIEIMGFPPDPIRRE